MQDAWGISAFGYDELSRLTARVSPRGDAIYYAYDLASNRTILQYPQDQSATYFGYDQVQRLEALHSSSEGKAYFAYDASSNCVRKLLGNGVTAYWSYDATDRASAIRYHKADGTAVASFDVPARNLIGVITQLRLY